VQSGDGLIGRLRNRALCRLRKNRQSCHPEEPQAVLSETKEGPPHLPDSTNAEILRFAQNDSTYEFFRSLFSA
jgi:hypothetical protein